MRNYKVFMDLSLVMSRLRKYSLGEYNSTFPIVFVEARNPDDACHIAVKNLISKLISQDGSPEGAKLCTEIKRDIRVIKAHVP